MAILNKLKKCNTIFTDNELFKIVIFKKKSFKIDTEKKILSCSFKLQPYE